MRPGEKKVPASVMEAKLRRMASIMTVREAAAELGMHPRYINLLARRYGVPFRHGNTKEATVRKRQKNPIQHIKLSGILSDLTPQERQDAITLLRWGGLPAADAMQAIKRPDLAARAKEMAL